MNRVTIRDYASAQAERSRRFGLFDTTGTDLPVRVRRLARREREVAMIVYRRGATTAKEVLSRLSVPISNGAVRSMLNRLVDKGILYRRGAGLGKAFVYLPAISTVAAIEHDFRRLADDYFGGSAERALNAIDAILTRSREISPAR